MATGLCECGCGAKAPVAPRNNAYKGWTAGQPLRYLPGHHRRRSPVDYIVDETTGCWLWQRGTRRRGYGQMQVDGRSRSAHHVYYERAHGPIPPGLILDHLCRIPACVNPDHLEPVTIAENCRRGKATKLTALDVAEIRLRYEAGGISYAVLGAEYGISQSQVGRIIAAERWVSPKPAAIRAATDGKPAAERSGTFVAVPARSWKPMTRKVDTVEKDVWS